MPATAFNAVVALRIDISPWLIILRVAPNGWTLPVFEPGQFAVLGLPGTAPRTPLSGEEENPPQQPEKMIQRAYSIASSSVQREYLEFYLALVSTGALTPRLFSLQRGEPLYLSPKITGMFTLDRVPPEANVVMIATGTGLAPYISMLGTYLTCGGPRRMAVLHGARHSWDLGYRSELMTMQHLCPNLTYLATISRPEEEPVPWGGQVGYVQDLWRKGTLAEKWGFKPTPEDTHIFLCGSPAMMDDVVPMLEREGFCEHTRKQPGQIHLERYW